MTERSLTFLKEVKKGLQTATNSLRVFQPGYITNPTTQGERERLELQ